LPDAGHVEVFGQRLSPHTARAAISRGVGMVQQHFRLIGALTVLDNAMLGVEPTRSFGRVDVEAAKAKLAKVQTELGSSLEPSALVGSGASAVALQQEYVGALERVPVPWRWRELAGWLLGMRSQWTVDSRLSGLAQGQAGAIASSVGHDNHNIIVLGTNHADMALAVNRVAQLQGGQVVVKDGEVTGEIAYPVLGLLTDLSAEEAAAKKKELNAQIHAMGSMIPIPFMFLSFISLAAIPEYAVTDHGFIDVLNQKIIDPVLEILTEGV
jgi:ABC-type branched-subunit amino acid transport system ATPase component